MVLKQTRPRQSSPRQSKCKGFAYNSILNHPQKCDRSHFKESSLFSEASTSPKLLAATPNNTRKKHPPYIVSVKRINKATAIFPSRTSKRD